MRVALVAAIMYTLFGLLRLPEREKSIAAIARYCLLHGTHRSGAAGGAGVVDGDYGSARKIVSRADKCL